jgi:hypothetical protein
MLVLVLVPSDPVFARSDDGLFMRSLVALSGCGVNE